MKPHEQKLRGSKGKISPVTRLKELVLKKAEVREQLWSWRNEPNLTNAAIRGRIEANWGIAIPRDDQMSEFWPWLRHTRRTLNWNARMEEFEAWYREKNPDASVERIRDAGIAFFMTETAADEDREGFVEIANLDLTKRAMKSKAHFEERKLNLAERKVVMAEAKQRAISAVNEVAKGGKIDAATKEEILAAIDRKLVGTI